MDIQIHTFKEGDDYPEGGVIAWVDGEYIYLSSSHLEAGDQYILVSDLPIPEPSKRQQYEAMSEKGLMDKLASNDSVVKLEFDNNLGFGIDQRGFWFSVTTTEDYIEYATKDTVKEAMIAALLGETD